MNCKNCIIRTAKNTNDLCDECHRELRHKMSEIKTKPMLHFNLMFPSAMAQLADALAYGKVKHGSFYGGKAEATDQKRIDSMLRHITSVVNGEEIDKESGLSHRSLILANAVFLTEARKG